MADQIGVLGKLPMHGDFIQRNLPGKVINIWHEWLQGFIGSSQEQLAEHWLDTYLTAPIWRFCLSPGVMNSQAWAGVLLPSVDRVGRYFPLLLSQPLPAETLITAFITQQSEWFRALEDTALAALEGQMNVDGLLAAVAELSLQPLVTARCQEHLPLRQGLVIERKPEEPDNASDSWLLQALIDQSYTSYSLWSTEGSVRVEPCSVISGGLPPLGQAAALLDGRWQHWQWGMPYALEQDAKPE